MRKYWKKWAAFCLACVLTAGIYGCGEEQDTEETALSSAETETEAITEAAETAAAAGGGVKTEESGQEKPTEGYMQEEVLENLVIDAEISLPSQETYSEYDAVLRRWGKDYADRMRKLFYENEEVTALEEESSSGVWELRGEKGDAVVSQHSLMYRSHEYQEKYIDLFSEGFREVLAEEAEQFPELEGGDLRRAERDVRKMAEVLEIPIGEESMLCCAIDGAGLNSLYERISIRLQGEPRDYSADEGIYYLKYPLIFQGEYVAQERSGTETVYGYLETGSYLTVLLRPDWEVLAFSCGPQYISGEAETKPVQILNLEAAVEMLKKEYEERVPGVRMTVKSIRFCYAPVVRSEKDYETGECGMVPAWEVRAVSEPTAITGERQREIFRFSALTGEKLEPYSTE